MRLQIDYRLRSEILAGGDNREMRNYPSRAQIIEESLSKSYMNRLESSFFIWARSVHNGKDILKMFVAFKNYLVGNLHDKPAGGI